MLVVFPVQALHILQNRHLAIPKRGSSVIKGTGNLFENFIVMERQKANAYQQRISQTYFWRTYDGQEVDVIEEHKGRIHGYEVKWSQAKKGRTPRSWKTTYPDAPLTLINRENHLPFIVKTKH